MESKVMVLREFNKPLEFEIMKIPELQEGQILVRIDLAGICGSDVHMYKGEDPRTPLPIILGHEGVGHIAAISGKRNGVRGTELKEGDRILWNRGYSCGKCEACVILKEPALCSNRKVYGINIGCEEEPYLNGCYSQYVILSKDTDIFPVDEAIPSGVLVTTACSGATIAHGFSMIKSYLGQTVLVQGPGPLGMYAIAFAKNLGASEIIVIGGSQIRLDMCKEFGATMVINRRTTTQEERHDLIMKKTGGRGVDLAVETAGSKGAIAEGIKLIRIGGTYLTIGFSQPAGIQQIDFYREVVKKNLRLQGVWVSDCSHTFQAIELCKRNTDIFSKLVTHSFPLCEANEAIALMDKKEALKIVLQP